MKGSPAIGAPLAVRGYHELGLVERRTSWEQIGAGFRTYGRSAVARLEAGRLGNRFASIHAAAPKDVPDSSFTWFRALPRAAAYEMRGFAWLAGPSGGPLHQNAWFRSLLSLPEAPDGSLCKTCPALLCAPGSSLLAKACNNCNLVHRLLPESRKPCNNCNLVHLGLPRRPEGGKSTNRSCRPVFPCFPLRLHWKR